MPKFLFGPLHAGLVFSGVFFNGGSSWHQRTKLVLRYRLAPLQVRSSIPFLTTAKLLPAQGELHSWKAEKFYSFIHWPVTKSVPEIKLGNCWLNLTVGKLFFILFGMAFSPYWLHCIQSSETGRFENKKKTLKEFRHLGWLFSNKNRTTVPEDK